MLALSALLLSLASPMVIPQAQAYAFTGCKFQNAPNRQSITSAYTGSNQAYRDLANWGRGYWNNSAQTQTLFTDVTFTPQVQIFEQNDGDTEFSGITRYNCASGVFSGIVRVNLNTFYTNGYNPYLNSWVMNHELGHAQGLAHAGRLCNSPPPQAAIMINSTSAQTLCGWVAPQSDDVAGINALYSP